MLSDSIITGKLLAEVSRALMPSTNTPEIQMDNLEPSIKQELKKVCQNMTNSMIDMRNMRTENFSIEEIITIIGPKFFMMGVVSAMIARDRLDELQVPDIAEYCKPFANVSKETQESTDKRLQNVIKKMRKDG